jgi:hypothetical protein
MSSPGDPDDEFQPRPLITARFWALMIFAAVCVLAGIAVAVLGPRLPLAAG